MIPTQITDTPAPKPKEIVEYQKAYRLKRFLVLQHLFPDTPKPIS